MTIPQPSAELLAAIAARSTQPSHERTAPLLAAAAELRDTDMAINELEERLAAARKRKNVLQFETLPAMLDNVGFDHIGLPAQDNIPAYDLMLQPYFHANIAANWAPERRAAAFAALEQNGDGDLIKTQLRISLPRGESELAAKIAELLRLNFNINPEITENVHHQTLTAWLQEQIENGQPLPDLETIGATVGRIARLKPRKE